MKIPERSTAQERENAAIAFGSLVFLPFGLIAVILFVMGMT